MSVAKSTLPPTETERQTLKVFVLSQSLGRVMRGYEAACQDLFAALEDEPGLDLRLFKAEGDRREREIPLHSLDRDSRLAQWLGRLSGKGGSFIEALTFGARLLPYLARERPDVVYLGDCDLCHLLWYWRKVSRANYKLVFFNGAPYPPVCLKCDHIQQVASTYYQAALRDGHPADRQSLIPHALDIAADFAPPSPEERDRLRARLDLPQERSIVLSVAAINKHHKRLDYVVREVAQLDAPRPYLLLLGQKEAEYPEILALANDLLGADQFDIRTVPRRDVPDYYRACDLFVLASTTEGFGIVWLEALAQGLPCLAHDYPVARFVLGEAGAFADFTQPGGLAGLVERALHSPDSSARDRHRLVFERFSWTRLRAAYLQMFRECCAR